MNRHLAFFMAAVGFGLLLSGTPVAAQNQGNSTFGVGACTATNGIAICPTVLNGVQDPNLLGACVNFANVCFNSGKTLYPQLADTCCARCAAFADLCFGTFAPGFDYCADSHSGFPLNCPAQ
jgi:hypothetical protein